MYDRWTFVYRIEGWSTFCHLDSSGRGITVICLHNSGCHPPSSHAMEASPLKAFCWTFASLCWHCAAQNVTFYVHECGSESVAGTCLVGDLLAVPSLCRNHSVLRDIRGVAHFISRRCGRVEDSGLQTCCFSTPWKCFRVVCTSFVTGTRNLFHDRQPLPMWPILDQSVLEQNIGMWRLLFRRVWQSLDVHCCHEIWKSSFCCLLRKLFFRLT